jgi:hypothetical protein
MRGQEAITALKRKLRLNTDESLHERIGISIPTIQLWKNRKKVTPRQFAELVHRAQNACTGGPTGNATISAVKKKFRIKTDEALKAQIGISIPTIQLWKGRTKVTARQFAELIHRARRAGAANVETTALRPLVEFFPVAKTKSKQGKKFELFQAPLRKGKKHPYLDGLRNELKAHHGVYVFFDSRGQVIYAGKARKQNLWNEMTNAFNRKRGDIQYIRRVKHPLRRQRYRTSQEKGSPDSRVRGAAFRISNLL